MKKFTITHKLLEGDQVSNFETQTEIDEHKLEHPELYEPNCETVLVDNSLILKDIKVIHTEKLTLKSFQSDFKSEYEYAKHQEAHPELYEPTCLVSVEDVTAQKTHLSKKLSKKEVRLACMDLFDEVAITNESANDAAMDAIFLNPSFMAIVGALVSGAPRTAKRYILSLGPSLYPNEKVTDIVNKLDAIIASEGG